MAQEFDPISPGVVPLESQVSDVLPEANSSLPEQENGLRFRIAELWGSIKNDYHEADRSEKVLMLSAAAFQVWNQSRLQQAVTIPAALGIYEATGYNEWVAGTSFAALNYVQQFGAAATLGAAARSFPESLETFENNFPAVHETAQKIEEKTSGYIPSLVNQTVTGQGLGAGPYVMTEVLSNPKGSTRTTVKLAEKVSRRIGIGSGLIGVGVMRLVEEYPSNDTVQRVAGHAQNPLTWIALGAAMYVPSMVAGGAKALMRRMRKHDESVDSTT